MQVLNAMDLKAGAKADYNKMGTLTQPIQFLEKKDKDQDWAAWNLDWLEWNGLKQLRRNARRLLKNYKLAKGIIDRTDYIVEEDNEYQDIVETLTQDDPGALELKFYPIIPNVVNTLCNEFAKRNTKMTYRSVDDTSYNEMMEQRRGMIEQNLIAHAEQKLVSRMMEMGADFDDPDIQEQLAPENLKTLPEIETFFRKTYTNVVEEWAHHQHAADDGRFRMDELEERGFRDALITDREFWHFKMGEDDYDVELWNPVLTFYHKSPEARYISQGSWVGKIEMMTVADVIDKFGWMMNEDQMQALEAIYPVRSAGYPITGYQSETKYDATQSHSWNVNMPSLAYRQFVSSYDGWVNNGDDIVQWILGESEDYWDFGTTHLLRVTTAYWKSQRKVGHLIKVDENGDTIQKVIDETYKVTDKAIYNTTLFKTKNKDNLVFGEHIDWIWINETWGGVKIGPNHSSFWGQNSPGGVNPMYLGVNQNKPARLKFQFKGDSTIYGCKLPVEGRVFSDRNTMSVSMVDLMKPWQIGYNVVNNQIADILVDELGTVLLLDQNALPRHSMGEDWGKHNLAKAYVAMKNFQMLPLDSSITNTENALSFQHYQKLDMEQTTRLIGRVNLANYFKQQAFENIGVTPQRMGQEIEQETAEGVRAAVSNSYAQTEQYFINHSDHLMPRVHQMRTDLAQYYQSNKPSVRLQYLTAAEEKMNFQIHGTDLLLRDLNIFPTTKANHRAVMEQLRQLAMSNNTAGASIYDLGNIIKADSIPEISEMMKDAEQKTEKKVQEDRQHQTQLADMQIKAEEKDKQVGRDFEQQQNEAKNRKDVLVAEIRAAGYGAMQDIDENKQSDFQDTLQDIQKGSEFQETMSLNTQKEVNKNSQHSDKMALEREKIAASNKASDTALQVARENKNRYDVKKPEKEK